MPKTYSVADFSALHHVVDSSTSVVLLPGVFLRELTGTVAASGVGNADGTASVNGTSGLVVVVSGTGNADGTSSVSGISQELVGAVGNADGVASCLGVVPVLTPGRGNANGIASVSAQSLVAYVVGNADGSADVLGTPATISNQTGNADGLGTALGGVKIPGDGCALIVGI